MSEGGWCLGLWLLIFVSDLKVNMFTAYETFDHSIGTCFLGTLDILILYKRTLN